MKHTLRELLVEANNLEPVLQANQSNIVLFGAANVGRNILKKLRSINIAPLTFTDNNPKLWGKTINDLEVLSPQTTIRNYGKDVLFIICVAYYKNFLCIKKQLTTEFNCPKLLFSSQLLPFINEVDDIIRTLDLWADEISKQIYLDYIKFYVILDFEGLPSPVTHTQYFPNDLYWVNSQECFVDCGGFNGDTLENFLQHYKNTFKKIIVFEPEPALFQALKHYIQSLPMAISQKIQSFPFAVGARQETVHFNASERGDGCITVNGSLEVKCVTLDELCQTEKITFIKMDIEGSELAALKGAKHIITSSNPILAICVYHRPEHIWEVPLFIRSLSDSYHFFLRPYDKPAELVCYAIPTEKLIKNMREES